jgi:trehalose/maltose transport system permease protein
VTAAAEATAEARSVAKVRVHKPLRKRLARLPFYLLIAAIFVYTIFPFYWAIRSSLTPDGDLFATPLQYFPNSPTLAHYREVLGSGDFQRALLNSTIVAGSVTLISLVLGAVASYALGRFRFRGRAFAMYLMLSMTIFPQIAILGALYKMITRFQLYDTQGALIFSYLIFTLPFTVWVLTSFTRGLPRDLEEAAYVDGATTFQAFRKVMLPLIAPGLVTTGLLAFIAAWNEFLYALSFTQSVDKHTVPIAIVQFTGKSGSTFQVPWGQIMAATIVVTVPLIVMTLILQRRILAGLTAGAVKG